MFFLIWWKDLEGEWIEEELFARDFAEADDKAALIAEVFGTGEHRTEIFGCTKSRKDTAWQR
jgi:hypothetical protein